MVRVARARDPIEGAMIVGLLKNAGISAALQPSGERMEGEGSEMAFAMLTRGSGGGAHDVMVAAGDAEQAAALLAEPPQASGSGRRRRPG